MLVQYASCNRKTTIPVTYRLHLHKVYKKGTTFQMTYSPLPCYFLDISPHAVAMVTRALEDDPHDHAHDDAHTAEAATVCVCVPRHSL